MKKNIKHKFKKGAASFYIVAFSTLILLIVATSFAVVIISEIERTSNEDLSQSAYDSAMAGIEDAKTAYYNYMNCVSLEDTSTGCQEIVDVIESPDNQDCDMVSRILGRLNKTDEGSEIPVNEVKSSSGASNNMQQAYTCVELKTKLKDYVSNLNSSNLMRVVKVKFASDKDENGNKQNIADMITKVKISWYANDGSELNYSNFQSNSIGFYPLSGHAVAKPPTISLTMVQTSEYFRYSDFEITRGNTTDRGTVYLVPTKTKVTSSTDEYNASKDGNYIDSNAFLSSNNKVKTNLPYTVHCPSPADGAYMCSATLELPRPVSTTGDTAARNQDTFMFVVSLPYGEPDTEFALEFFCGDNNSSCTPSEFSEDGGSNNNQAYLDGVQIEVDSTGRANDLYRRLEARFEAENDSSYLSIMGPLELLGGSDNSGLLNKNYTVKCEYNFGTPTC